MAFNIKTKQSTVITAFCVAVLFVFCLIFIIIAFATGEKPQPVAKNEKLEDELLQIEGVLADPLLNIVNPDHILRQDYKPANIYTIPTEYCFWDKEFLCSADNQLPSMLVKLFDATKENGFDAKIALSYRSFEKQQSLYEASDKPENQVLPGGASEHQYYTAFDIMDVTDYNKDRFMTTELYSWLKDNSYKYGFIMRYKEEYVSYTGIISEPWHLRYVGVEYATQMYETDMSLEQYIDSLITRASQICDSLEIKNPYKNATYKKDQLF